MSLPAINPTQQPTAKATPEPGPAFEIPGQAAVPTAPPPVTERFLCLVGVAAVLFLAIVFSVFREIEHNRELYDLSRKLAATEANARHWQEQLRLEEARSAGLEAALQARTFDARNPQAIQADYLSAN
jgi:hypothetical protein